MRSKSASEVCTSRLTPSSDPIGKKSRVWRVVNATSSGIDTAFEPLARRRPPNQ